MACFQESTLEVIGRLCFLRDNVFLVGFSLVASSLGQSQNFRYLRLRHAEAYFLQSCPACRKEDITMMDQHSQSLQSVMTTDVTSLPPSASVFQAAKQMKELNVGAIPICDGRHLIG